MKKIVISFSAAAAVILYLIISLFLPETVDVLVIGGGAAGLSAAIEAAEKGADVILLEKMNYLGGNTRRATGGMNAAGTDAQAAAGIEDSIESFFNDTMESGHQMNNEVLVRIMVERSASSVAWLTGFEADLSDVGRLAGHSVSRTHRPRGGAPVGREIVPVLTSKVKALGVDVRTENRATALTSRPGRKGKPAVVTGAYAETNEGREYRIRAKAVVIATGGFGASPELYVRMNPALKGFKTTNHPGANGDYLYLVEGLDAALVDMEFIQTHPTVEPDNGVLITEAIRGNGGILVNSEGWRFTDELGFRDVLSREILAQRAKSANLIFDRNIRDSLTATDTYFALNLISRADKLEDLADLLSINPRGLVEAVARYNSLQAGRGDEDFGRNNLPRSIIDPPFYGIRVAPAVHHCMGGLRINEKTEVLTQSGLPIGGLFAAGEATGGIHAANRLGGNSLTDAVTFGRISGEKAALMAGYTR
ncbi:MAG: flavocytochrome c [Spirochaetales bacterium]|nr:flavocytochrome c [Spirochaetales bacterium]